MLWTLNWNYLEPKDLMVSGLQLIPATFHVAPLDKNFTTHIMSLSTHVFKRQKMLGVIIKAVPLQESQRTQSLLLLKWGAQPL